MPKIKEVLASVVDELKKRQSFKFAQEINLFANDLSVEILSQEVEEPKSEVEEITQWFLLKQKETHLKTGDEWDDLKAILLANEPEKSASLNATVGLLKLLLKTLDKYKPSKPDVINYKNKLKKEITQFLSSIK